MTRLMRRGRSRGPWRESLDNQDRARPVGVSFFPKGEE
jgi:hypothetical protein